MVGSNWGLPVRLHPDEGLIVSPALDMINRKSFEPAIFARPDHLEIQINSIVYRLISFILQKPVSVLAAERLEIFYLAARVITGLFSCSCVLIAYLIGKRQSRLCGIVMAAFIMLFPIYTTHAHYATPDMPTVFFMLLFILFSLRYVGEPTIKHLFLCSMATAFFITVKYPGAITCGGIVLSVIYIGLKNKDLLLIVKHGLLSIVFVVFCLFLISPVLFTNYEAVIKGFINETTSTHLGADGLGFGGNMLYYVETYFNSSGVLLLVPFLYGCLIIIVNKDRLSSWFPVFYGFIYWICLSYVARHMERWGLPMFVSPLLISAMGLTRLIERHVSGKSLNRVKIAALALIGLALVNQLSGVAANLSGFIVKDTRVLSKQYCEENNITTQNSVYEGYTTLAPTGPKNVNGSFIKTDRSFQLNSNAVSNIILSSNMYDRYKAEPERYKDMNMLYDAIEKDYEATNQYIPAALKRSPFEFISIYNNLKYVWQTLSSNMSGPTLLFYRANRSNYPQYELGQPIIFNEAEKNYSQYITSGLVNQEKDGCWSNGEEVIFLLYLSADAPRNLTLQMDINPLTGESLSGQHANIFVNGDETTPLYITDDGIYETPLTLPESFDGALEIKFVLPDAAAPKLIGLNEDERILALFFQQIIISEQQY
jgi:hypothetical protein